MSTVTNVSENATAPRPRASTSLFWGQIWKLIEVVLSFVFSIIIVRQLAPANYGIYSLLTTIMAFSNVLVAFGFADMINKQAPAWQVQSSPEKIRTLLRVLLSQRVIYSVLLGVVVWFLRDWLGSVFGTPHIADYMVYAIISFIAMGATEVFVALFTGILRVHIVAIVKGITQVFYILFTLVSFHIVGPTLDGLMWGLVISSLMAPAMYAISAAPWLFGKAAPSTEARPDYHFGITVWLAILVNFGLTSQVDVMVVGAVLNDTVQVGYYALASMIMLRAYWSLHGWQTVLLPVFADRLARDGTNGMLKAWQTYLKLQLLVGVPAFVFIAGFAYALVPIIFSETYQPSVLPLTVFASVQAFACCFGPWTGYFGLYALNRHRTVLLIRAVTGILNVILDVILVSSFGIMGAVIATSLSATLLTPIWEYLVIRQSGEMRYPLTFALKVIFASLLPLAILRWYPITHLVELAVAGALYGILVGALLIALRPLSADDASTLQRSGKIGRLVVRVLYRSVAPTTS